MGIRGKAYNRGDTVTSGQGARVKLARGQGDTVTRGHGVVLGRDAVAPLQLIQGTRGETRTRRSRAPTQ